VRGLEEAFDAVLDRRLTPACTVPLVVALSGGGDSVAVLALATAWARRRSRAVLALTVDHGLQLDSASWARFAAEVAKRLGAAHRVLEWTGIKPTHGAAAAARQARHALLAEAARAAGAGVLLMGHTADDRLEGAAMQALGVPLGTLRTWGPSPAWPEGRRVMLLRPLLEVRRAALRDWLVEQGLPWIDDPANTDPRSIRARVRADPASGPPPPLPFSSPSPLLSVTTITEDGRIRVPRGPLAEAGDGRRFAAAAVACAAGSTGGLRRDRLDALLGRIRGSAPFVATLGGARVSGDALTVSFAREAGEVARGGLACVELSADRPVVWDGRFEAPPTAVAGRLGPLRGRRSLLPQDQRRALGRFPAAARDALPVLISPAGEVTGLLLAAAPQVRLVQLVSARLAAALDGVDAGC
jgi:tRNA(Ile)-lysidine synthase